MMKKLIIYGAGDLGKEYAWIINSINKVTGEWELLGFVDDGLNIGTAIYKDLSVLGGMEYFNDIKDEIYVVCSIAIPKIKKRIINKLKNFTNIKYPILIHPNTIISDDCKIGEGTLVAPFVVISLEVEIGAHIVINQNVSISHNCKIGDYSMVAPGCNLGGHIKVGECVDFGISCSAMVETKIGDNVILGAGAVVVKDIPSNCTAVGIPAKPIKFHKED